LMMAIRNAGSSLVDQILRQLYSQCTRHGVGDWGEVVKEIVTLLPSTDSHLSLFVKLR